MPISFDSASIGKHALRRQLRRSRRGLADTTRDAAAEQVATIMLDQLLRREWRRVAAYSAVASELDLSSLFARLPDAIELHLPAIDANGAMSFRRWRTCDELVPGPHDIAQPATTAVAIEPDRLDAVFLPLLGFDRDGARLGSGAGYYDRALALRLERPAPPHLIGVAFAVQEMPALPRDPWDVPLDAVVTERGWLDMAPTP